MSVPPLSDLGAYRTPLPVDADLTTRLERNGAMLGRALNMPSTVAVVGAGLSRPAGYPNWLEFADQVLDAAVEGLTQVSQSGSTLRRLEAVRHRLLNGLGRIETRTTFAVSAALAELQRHDQLILYEDYLERTFRPREHRLTAEDDPYQHLVCLGFRRFATTNYDVELERAILGHDPQANDLVAPSARLQEGDPPAMLSLVQTRPYQAALASFALARLPHAPKTVLHLHGRYDLPKSIVATEADYQAWYLGDDATSQAFRQTLELLFTSNPIVFVGYGLGDEDPLRILRRFTHRDPKRKEFRPLFAVMPTGDGGPDEVEVAYLYERYGLHVVPFAGPIRDDARSWGAAYCKVLDDLAKLRNSWRDGWLRKPQIRSVKVAVSPPDPYHHYFLDTGSTVELGPERVGKNVDQIARSCRAGSRVVVVLGPGGTGKSWAAKRLIEHLGRTESFMGRFFWSSYYTDDAITGLDRALAYLDPEGRFEGGRFKRFKQCLEDPNRRHLLVFDGFERLLFSDQRPEIGYPSTAGIRRFLEVIADDANHSTVLLTSRLWPDLERFGTIDQHPGWLELVRLGRMRTADIAGQPPFTGFDETDVSALCSLLEGHTYGLVLASRYLTLGRTEGPAEGIRALCAKLSRRNPALRNTQMIALLIERLCEVHGEEVQAALERLALFMSPVPYPVVLASFDAFLRKTSARPPGEGTAKRIMEALVSNQLLFLVRAGQGDPQEPAYTVHPTVRGYVFHRLHGAGSDALPNFTLPGFTSGTAIIHPGRGRSIQVVSAACDELFEHAKRAEERGDRSAAVAFARALFGLIRSRMESLTVPRWETYQFYLVRCFRLANLIRRLSVGTWSFADPSDLDRISSPEAILYADELAWLYNDIGLACCSEGNMIDAASMWDQGYEINRVIEEEHGGHYVVQSLLHLCHVFMELGRLDSTRHYLRESERVNDRYKDSDYQARIQGYRGIVHHLQGDWRRAAGCYRNALALLRQKDRNPRAQSFFLFHWANLLGAMGRFPQAANLLQQSESIAEAGNYPDLSAFAKCGLGTLLRRQKLFTEARAEFRASLDEAQRMGVRRLEADVLSELSRLACDLGDYQTARQRAIESLAIANEMGLGLRQTSGLYVLGLAMHGSGHTSFGIDYLRQARDLARRQHYRSREREISGVLGLIGEAQRSEGYGREG